MEWNFNHVFIHAEGNTVFVDGIYITILNFIEKDRTRIVFIYRMTKERELESVVKREASLQPATI